MSGNCQQATLYICVNSHQAGPEYSALTAAKEVAFAAIQHGATAVGVERFVQRGGWSTICLYRQGAHSDQEIQESLKQVSSGRTTLIIAHRLSTVVDADEIIVLEEGRVAERGHHADLLERKGPYAAMWAKQQEAAMHEAKLAEAVGE